MLIRKLATENYQRITSHGVEEGTLAALASGAGDDPVTLVMTAGSCTHREVPFEKHERRLLDRIIPWSLEEDLVDRVDDLHFVITPLPQNPSGTAAVCYLDKTVLASELEGCAAAGITLKACLPELTLLPWQPGRWTIAATGDGQYLVRASANRGLACNEENLGNVLRILARDLPVPAGIDLLRAPGSAVDAQILVQWLPGFKEDQVSTRQVDYPRLLLDSIEREATGVMTPNLLSGEFAPRLPWGAWWQQWRIAAILVLAVGVVDVAARFAETRKLAQLNTALAMETETVFRQVVPDGVMVDPGLQLQRRLAALQGDADAGFIAMLNRAAPVLMDNPALEVQNLNYSGRDGEMTMTLVTEDFNVAESIRTRLQELGLQAELTGSASSPEGNRSTLSIVRGGVSG